MSSAGAYANRRPVPKGAIPDHARDTLRAQLEQHASGKWGERCKGIVVRFRGAFAYVDAFASESFCPPWLTAEDRARIDSTPTRLCRLGYLGSADHWAFAFYKYSDETYEPSILLSGSFAGTPEEAFDTAAQAYLGP